MEVTIVTANDPMTGGDTIHTCMIDQDVTDQNVALSPPGTDQQTTGRHQTLCPAVSVM